MSSVARDVDKFFTETLALVILKGSFTAESEYQKGWLDGYAKAYTQMTGKTIQTLINQANSSIEGSGKPRLVR